ncbi:hypothetical protein BGX33_009980 [Mortierella sp. NVP41]|nr:hypothetical protein BGX33_009980 [Mortierella sp. NVP41]
MGLKKFFTLQLPEILSRIFLFIDDETLHESVILVSRQWYYLNQSRIVRELAWAEDSKNNSYKTLDKLLTRFPQATRLQWHSTDVKLKEKHTLKLLQALQGNKDRYQLSLNPSAAAASAAAAASSKKDKKTPLKSDGLLRDLDLSCPAPLLLKVLPFLQSLTSLRVQLLGSETIRIDTILAACPNLLSLRLETSSGVLQLPASWVSQTLSASSLLLQSLILENVIFSQSSLEQLLTVTPHLSVLQLRNLRQNASPAPPLYDWPKLAKYLRTKALSLSSIHFSIYGQPMASEEEVNEKIFFTPQSREWVFRTYDLTPTLTHCLRELPNVVTSLELIAPGRPDPNCGLELHQYLCASPHLLHLKASQSVCLIERMDIHRRWSPSTRAGLTEDRRAGIWACRNLRTLHIRVHNLGSLAIQNSPVRSRILFGYISRVLPQLRDLYLYELENDPGLCLDLFGGLALLAQLRHLESFRLGTGKSDQLVRPGDISWMIPSGQSKLAKSERSDVVFTWDQILPRDRAQEANRVASYAGRDLAAELVASAPTGIVIEPGLITSLADLGLLLDVKALVTQMNSKEGYVSWPKLKFMTVYQPLAQKYTVEKCYNRIGNVAASDIDTRINDDIAAMLR